jgi:hypothetical protein
LGAGDVDVAGWYFVEHVVGLHALRTLVGEFGEYFGGTPKVMTAITNGGWMEALLDARKRETQVRAVTLLYDRPGSLAGALARLAREAPRPTRGGGTPVPRLRTVNFPDQSGSIGIPDSWVMDSASEGGVTVHGPQGEHVVLQSLLGCRSTNMPVGDFPGNCVLPFIADPVRALVAIVEQTGGSVRVLEKPANDRPELRLRIL